MLLLLKLLSRISTENIKEFMSLKKKTSVVDCNDLIQRKAKNKTLLSICRTSKTSED